MNKILILPLLLLSFFVAEAQMQFGEVTHRRCAADEHRHYLEQQNPDLLEHRRRMDGRMNRWIRENPNFNHNRATYTIPVVFHVVYANNAQNIPDAYIMAQLDQLNADFTGNNSDLGNTPAEFPTGNPDIEFCLAIIDPDGNPTTGITRTSTSAGSFSYEADDVKSTATGGVDAWNTQQYMNIWICPLSGGTLGYAQFPASYASSPHTAGVVLGYQTVGSLTTPNPQGAPYDKGRTATHEMGHALALYHIWGDDVDGCSGTDEVADTPNQAGLSTGCPVYPTSSCGSNDMTMNYMDYSNDACLTAFTPGQSARIVSAINTYGYLQYMVDNADVVCGAAVPTAGINASSTSGCSPFAVTFSSNSTGGAATSYSWSFPGGTPSSASGANPPVVTYANPGVYTAMLTVSNSDGGSPESITITVQDCGNLDCNGVDNLNGGELTVTDVTGGAAASGYYSGHNNFNDKAIAEHFTGLPAGAQINGVDFAFVGIAGSGMVEFVIWQDYNGQPGAELYTDQVSIATLEANLDAGNPTTVGFGGAVSVGTSCFVGCKMEYGDYLYVVATNSDGETNPGTAWTQLSDNTWVPFSDPDNWNVNQALAIYANVCVEGGGTAPTANFSYNILSEGCETVQVQYSDNSAGMPTEWQWSFPGGSPSSSNERNPIVTYTEGGAYGATLTATNAAGSNTSTLNNIIGVSSALELDAVMNENDGAADAMIDLSTHDGVVNFQDNTPGANDWLWDFGTGGGTANTQAASYTYTEEGTYTITLTVSDGAWCTEMGQITLNVVNATPVADIKGLSAMSLMPNPVMDRLNLQLSSEQPLDLQVQVYDAIGREVLTMVAITVSGQVTEPIDVSGLPAGTYFLRLTDGRESATSRFVKM